MNNQTHRKVFCGKKNSGSSLHHSQIQNSALQSKYIQKNNFYDLSKKDIDISYVQETLKQQKKAILSKDKKLTYKQTNYKHELEQLKVKLNQLDEDNKKLKCNLNQKTEEVKKMRSKFNAKIDNIYGFNSHNVQHLENQYNRNYILDEVEKKKAQIESLKNTIIQMEKSIQFNQLKEICLELDIYKKQCKKLKNRNQELCEIIGGKNIKEIIHEKISNKKLKKSKKIKNLREQNEKKDKTIQQMKQQLDQKDQHIYELQNQINSCLQEIQILVNPQKQIQQQNQSKYLNQEQYQNSLNLINSQIVSNQTRFNNEQNQNNITQNGIKSYNNQIQGLEQQPSKMSQIKDINLQNNSRSLKQGNSIQVDKQQSTKQVQQILLQQQQTEKDSYRQKNQYSYQNSVYQKQLPKQYNFISNDSHNNINSRIQSNQPSHLGSNYSHQNYFSNEISEMMEDENEYLNGIEQNPSFVEKIQQKYLQNDSYQIPNQE